MGSGKSSTSTQQVQIPQEVLQRYSSVNQTAETAAAKPFQQYSTSPDAFVAPLNTTQQSGIANTNAAAGLAQPYYGQATEALGAAGTAADPYNTAAGQAYNGAVSSANPYNLAATGLAAAGTQAVDPTNLGAPEINRYLNPYIQSVLGGTAGILNQQNQQQQAGQLGNAIRQGGFGGDRAGLAAANLEQQQNLANSQIYSGILSQGYGQALSTAQQQQQLGLGAAQANRTALQTGANQLGEIGQQVYGQQLGAGQATQGLGQQVYAQGANTSQQLAGLGAGAQAAALQGAQAQLAAGQTAQQTEQAGKQALYNQFLQQQSYPFQTAQFLANIAEGTGSLSGSTTTTTQPGGFFSDKRLKENIKKIGETFDKQPIYSYNYRGDDGRQQIGLLAQEVERRHPDAVGLARGYKTVDYGKATGDAAKRGHFARGGPTGDIGGYDYMPGEMDAYSRQAFLRNKLDAANDSSKLSPLMKATIAQAYLQANADSAQAFDDRAASRPQGDPLSLEDMWLPDPDAGEKSRHSSDNAAGLARSYVQDFERGHFAEGGVAGYDPNLMAAILSNQAGMYGPYLSGLGGVGTGAGVPGGGSSRVPAANLPVGHLMTAGALPAQRTGMDSVNDAVGAAKGVKSLYDTGKGLAEHFSKSADDKVDISEALEGLDRESGLARGGLVGYAAGGMPYEPQISNGLDIPDTDEKYELMQPGDMPGKPKSGLSQVKDIAKIAAMFAASGGRIEKAAGGELEALREDIHPSKSLLQRLLAEEPPAEPAEEEASVSAPSGGALPALPAIQQALAVAKSASPSGDVNAKGTRADRNNNPGNIEDGKFAKSLPGYAGSDGRFAMFKTPDDGKEAQQRLLASYLKRGYDTPLKLASRWAPAGDGGNDPMVYAKFIASKLGIAPEDRLTSSHLNGLGEAQARMEGWRKGYAGGGTIIGPDGTYLPNSDADVVDLGEARVPPQALAPAGLAAATADMDTNDIPVDPVRHGPSPTDRQGLVPYDTPFIKGIGRGESSSILPILSGLAAMGTAPTRHLGTALAAGLGAGVESYQGLRDFDLKRIAAERAAGQLGVNQRQVGVNEGELGLAGQMVPSRIALNQAQAGFTNVQAEQQKALTNPLVAKAIADGKLTTATIQQVLAGVVDLTLVPGGGASGNGQIVVTNKAKAASGDPSAVSTIDVGGIGSPGSTAPMTGSAPPVAVAPSAKRQPAVQPKSWKPTDELPAGYVPPGQQSMFWDKVSGPLATTNGQHVVTDAAEKSAAASRQLVQLGQMGRQFANMPVSGFLTSGTGATARANIAKKINTIVQALGGQPIFDPSNLAAVENLSKDSSRLGFALARTLGAREPASIIEQSITLNPGVENTPMGYARLSSSAVQAARWEQLRSSFLNKYFAKWHHTNGADDLFRRANPPEMYAKLAIMGTVDPRDKAYLLKHAKDPKARAIFDEQYGQGVSGYFTGQ